jgi:hypothetical protein
VTLSVAAFARILARIERELEAGPALAEAGIDEAQWADEKAAFVAQARERPAELSHELAQAFAEARTSLEDGGPEPAEALPAPPAPLTPDNSAQVEPSRSVAPAVPTYLMQDAMPRDVVEPVNSIDPDATAAIPVHAAVGRAIPFSGDRSEAHLRELAAQRAPSRADRLAGPDETVLAPQQVLLQTIASGSFRDALAPVVVPQLTVADYADLRARLVVFGEDHVASLRHHGVLSVAAKEALERAFRSKFEADAVLRARFEATIRERVRHHRRGDS